MMKTVTTLLFVFSCLPLLSGQIFAQPTENNQQEPSTAPTPQDPAPTTPDSKPVLLDPDLEKSLSPGVEPQKGSDNKPGSDTKQGSDTKKGSDTKQGSNTKQGSATKDGSGIQPGSQTKQGSDTSNDPPVLQGEEVDEAFEKFNRLVQEVKTNEQTINQLVISMPIGFPEKRKAQQARVASMRQRNAAIVRELQPAAIESFEKFPNTQPSINRYLLQLLQSQLTGRSYRQTPFDPFAALASYKRLSEGGVDMPVLYMFGYRVYYVLNDFKSSILALRKAAEMGQQIDARAFEDLRRVNELWQRELEFRKQDAEKENPLVRIEMDCGVMVVELFEDQAPNTVANFITLVQDGFYNGLLFYQVNPTEVALTGSPTNDGQGGPGYNIKREIDDENKRNHFTGSLSMLGDGQNSAGSRFLITKQPRPKFDGRITVFGRIVEGMDNLYKINVVNRTNAMSKNDTTQPTQIIRISVVRKRDHEYAPEKLMATPPGG